MSELSKKYGIPETAVKAMIKDGWLSCSVSRYEEVYFHYKSKAQSGKSQAVKYASDMTGYSESMVYYIIDRFE